MGQPIRFVKDWAGNRRAITIRDFDGRGYGDYMWVYTRPSFDPVYHIRKAEEHTAICGKDVTYWEPSLAYHIKTPPYYCGYCYRYGFSFLCLSALGE